jgi:DNA-binding response OmpR family regulator/chromosome segregation ATPase
VPSALIIDADDSATDAIQGSLDDFGFDFTTTQDAPEAISLAKTATPDIIFLRVELPNASGFSVCNKLRRNQATKTIPLVMYSSDVTDDVFDQHRNLKTHADEYLKLPFGDGDLLGAVRQLLALPDAVEAAESADALEVDLDDVEEIEEDKDGLAMEEYDSEFQEMGTEASGQVTEDSGDLEDETDAAFNGITLGEAAAEPEEAAVEDVVEDDGSAAAASGGFKSAREVIQLKSQVNAKNREILELKGELEAAERGVLDAKHKQRELQAQISDLEEKLLTVQEETITAKEKSDAAGRDKRTILKREEGLKTRLDVAQKKVKEFEAKMGEVEATADAAKQRAAEAEEVLRASLEETQSNLRDAESEIERLGAAVIETREERDALEEKAEEASKKSGQLTDTISQLEGELVEIRRSSEEALDKARTEAAANLEAELESAGEQAAADKEQALEAQAKEHQSELEFEEKQHESERDKLRAEIERLSSEAEGERTRSTERIESLEIEVSDTKGQLETTDRLLGKSRDELRAHKDAAQRAQQALAVALRVLDEQSTE